MVEDIVYDNLITKSSYLMLNIFLGYFSIPIRFLESKFSLSMFIIPSTTDMHSSLKYIYLIFVLIFDYTIISDAIPSWIHQENVFIRSALQEASRLKKYNGKRYYEDSWSDIIHQSFGIKQLLPSLEKIYRLNSENIIILSMLSNNGQMPTNGEYIHWIIITIENVCISLKLHPWASFQ